MISATRRKLLGFLAAAPLAGKAVADEAIAKLSGVSLSGLGAAGQRISTGGGGSALPPSTAPDGYNAYVAANNLFRTVGMPAWFDEQLRDQARVVYALDPDIANKRSWSMAVKIITQRQRNYELAFVDLARAEKRSIGRTLAAKLMGGYWPW